MNEYNVLTGNVEVDVHRIDTRGGCYTNLDWLKHGERFPNYEKAGRDAVYRYNHRLYTGEYAKDKMLVALIDNVEREIPYRMLNVNLFKLVIEKLMSLVFSNEMSVRSGDVERDKRIKRLLEKTYGINGTKGLFKKTQIYGDGIIRTNRNGFNAVDPINGFKVVSKYNKQNVNYYVLYNFIFDSSGAPAYIRFEIHDKGNIYECVHEYVGSIYSGVLGSRIAGKYNGRYINAKGNNYKTGVDDIELVQWGSTDISADGVYGTSSFKDISGIVFALEQRLSSELHILKEHEKPTLILGASNFEPDESTGGYRIKSINDKYLISREGENKPEYVTWDGKLDNSKMIRDDLLSLFYELSELGKPYLTGEYGGNITEETFNNLIKSAIDRGNRNADEIYYPVKNSIYTLCRLNGIELDIEELTIDFSIGRTDDDRQVAEIIKTVNEAGIFSKETMLERFYSYNSEQAKAEIERIKAERHEMSTFSEEGV